MSYKNELLKSPPNPLFTNFLFPYLRAAGRDKINGRCHRQRKTSSLSKARFSFLRRRFSSYNFGNGMYRKVFASRVQIFKPFSNRMCNSWAIGWQRNFCAGFIQKVYSRVCVLRCHVTNSKHTHLWMVWLDRYQYQLCTSPIRFQFRWDLTKWQPKNIRENIPLLPLSFLHSCDCLSLNLKRDKRQLVGAGFQL